jgi:hypothetical protein
MARRSQHMQIDCFLAGATSGFIADDLKTQLRGSRLQRLQQFLGNNFIQRATRDRCVAWRHVECVMASTMIGAPAAASVARVQPATTTSAEHDASQQGHTREKSTERRASNKGCRPITRISTYPGWIGRGVRFARINQRASRRKALPSSSV